MEIEQLCRNGEADDEWMIKLSIEAAGGKGPAQCFTDIHGDRAEFTAEPGRRTARQISVKNPTLWFPAGYGTPHLYPLSIGNGEKQVNMHIGFAEKLSDGRSISVNGKDIRIKAARIDGSAPIAGMIRSAMTAGVNLLVSETALPEEAYEECDRLGMLLAAPEANHHPSSISLQALPEIDFREEEAEPLFFRTPSSSENALYLSELGRTMRADMAIKEKRASLMPLSLPLSEDRLSMLRYAGRMFFADLQPVMITHENELLVYIANDSGRCVKGELSLKIRDYAGNKKFTIEYEFDAEPYSCALLDRVQLGRVMRSECFCNAKLATKDLLRERTILLDTPRRSRLLPPLLTSETTPIGGSFNVKLNVKNPAFFVTLVTPYSGTFSDNIISVRPSAEKNIIFTPEESVDILDFERTLRIFDLASASL